jgi:HSP20 family protein
MSGSPRNPKQEVIKMRVIKWEPFRDADDVFDRFIADTMRRWARPGTEAAPAVHDWAPAVDVSETDTEYLIKAELPEVRKEDVSITVEDGMLSLTGERKQEKSTENEKLHRVERSYGTFARRFALPENVDDQAIRAESRDGVILVHLPKQKVETPQPRQIQIQ